MLCKHGQPFQIRGMNYFGEFKGRSNCLSFTGGHKNLFSCSTSNIHVNTKGVTNIFHTFKDGLRKNNAHFRENHENVFLHATFQPTTPPPQAIDDCLN